MEMKGIDVSYHDGKIDFKKVKNDGYKFIIIRAGYGQNNVDAKFKEYMDEVLNEGLYVGCYWFSYANDVNMAIKEAEYFNNVLKPYKGKLLMPVSFDFEYDSENHMKKNGVNPCKRLNTDIAKAFCKKMQSYGWYVMNYTNKDFYDNHFYYDELKDYDIWYARYISEKQNYPIWQYSDVGKVSGISGNVDINVATVDYPNIIKNGGFNGYRSDDKVLNTIVYDNEADRTISEVLSWKINDCIVKNINDYKSYSTKNLFVVGGGTEKILKDKKYPDHYTAFVGEDRWETLNKVLNYK